MSEDKKIKNTDNNDSQGFTMSDKNTSTQPPLPEIDFSTFIFSLNTSALMHLGILTAPGTDKKGKNIPAAKQTIDILAMLEKKTKGNLTIEEENLIKNFLHDLRIMYVKECG